MLPDDENGVEGASGEATVSLEGFHNFLSAFGDEGKQEFNFEEFKDREIVMDVKPEELSANVDSLCLAKGRAGGFKDAAKEEEAAERVAQKGKPNAIKKYPHLSSKFMVADFHGQLNSIYKAKHDLPRVEDFRRAIRAGDVRLSDTLTNREVAKMKELGLVVDEKYLPRKR